MLVVNSWYVNHMLLHTCHALVDEMGICTVMSLKVNICAFDVLLVDIIQISKVA